MTRVNLSFSLVAVTVLRAWIMPTWIFWVAAMTHITRDQPHGGPPRSARAAKGRRERAWRHGRLCPAGCIRAHRRPALFRAARHGRSGAAQASPAARAARPANLRVSAQQRLKILV